jgi:uncharacterized protein YecT (DUF1311 family)
MKMAICNVPNWLVCVLLVPTMAWVQSASVDKTEWAKVVMADECYANEYEIARCLSQLRLEEEARLKELRSKLRATLEEAQRKPFDDLDDAWKKHRQASCDFDSVLAAGNSRSSRFASCMLTHTRFRARVLSIYLTGISSGEYGNGIGIYMFESGLVSAESPIDPPECSKLKALLDGHDVTELRKRGLYREASSRRESYMNVDLDDDDISDELIAGCPASVETGDPCTASVKLSSGKKQSFQFNFGESYILLRFTGKVYAVTNQKDLGERSVVAFDRNGIQRVCTKL